MEAINTRGRRLVSFFLTAVLLFGMLPSNYAQASGADLQTDVSESIVLEPGGGDHTGEGLIPSGAEESGGEEYLGSAEGNGPEADEPPAGEELNAPSDGEETPAEGEEPPATPTDLPNDYENSISGMLWLDTYENIENEIIGGDGIRQPEEEALPGYAVSLYPAEDRGTAVQTDTTDGSGEYRFENIEPGTYVVGISGTTSGGVEYLLPIAGDTGDNQFSDFSANHTTIYSASIEVEEDTSVSGINAGMRMPQGNAAYENSISGMLWLDTYENIENGIIGGDGIRQPEEDPLPGYPVSLYLSDDRENAVQTTATGADGYYCFDNIEPGSYVVGISAATIDEVDYLLPVAGITADNKFGDFSEDYDIVFSAPIEIAEDTVVTGMNAGMRTPPQLQPDALGDYNTSDVNAINVIIDNNGLIAAKNYPDSWGSFAYWTGSAPNKRLYMLTLSGKNLTGTLNLMSCYSLEHLNVSNNKLNTIWLDRATLLNQVYCYNNPNLRKIDIPNSSGSHMSMTIATATGGSGAIAAYNHSTHTLEIQATPNPGYRFDKWTTSGGLSYYTIGSATYVNPTLYVSNSYGNITITPSFVAIVPTAITAVPTNVKSTSATLNATYNLQGASLTSGYFRYSTDPGLAGYTAVNFDSGHTATAGSTAISGLAPNTTYYYCVFIQTAGGPAQGTIQHFTTPLPPPTVTTDAVSDLTTAILSATYDLHGKPMTSGVFRYGTNASLSAGYTDVPFDAGYTTTNGATSISGLIPNTRYYYKAIVSTADGPGEGAIQSFVTLPDFSYWDADIWGSTTALITGSFAGSTGMITAATITYGQSSDLSDGINISLNNASGGGEGFGTAGVFYTLSGLTGLGSTTPWYVKITLTNAGGSTTTEIRPIGASYTVSVKYLDKDGGVLGERTDLVSTINIPYTLPTAINNHQAIYYKVNGGGRQEINPASPPTLTITGHTQIAVYCASTIMNISYPVSGMNFAALHTNGGAVTSGRYDFKNQSDLPVRVSFKEMSVTNSDGLNFVSNATADGEIHLNLVPVTGANTNGFTGISNIAPGSYTSLLGTLDGDMVGNAGTSWGYLSIGGHYEGPFTLTPKQPELEFTFNFVLVQ